MQFAQASKRRREQSLPKVSKRTRVDSDAPQLETCTNTSARPASKPWYFVTLNGQGDLVWYRWHPHTTPDAARVEATLKAVHVMAEPLKMATLLAWMFATSEYQGAAEPREQHITHQQSLQDHEARMGDKERALVTQLLLDRCTVGQWEVLVEKDFAVWGLQGVLVVHLNKMYANIEVDSGSPSATPTPSSAAASTRSSTAAASTRSSAAASTRSSAAASTRSSAAASTRSSAAASTRSSAAAASTPSSVAASSRSSTTASTPSSVAASSWSSTTASTPSSVAASAPSSAAALTSSSSTTVSTSSSVAASTRSSATTVSTSSSVAASTRSSATTASTSSSAAVSTPSSAAALTSSSSTTVSTSSSVAVSPPSSATVSTPSSAAVSTPSSAAASTPSSATVSTPSSTTASTPPVAANVLPITLPSSPSTFSSTALRKRPNEFEHVATSVCEYVRGKCNNTCEPWTLSKIAHMLVGYTCQLATIRPGYDLSLMSTEQHKQYMLQLNHKSKVTALLGNGLRFERGRIVAHYKGMGMNAIASGRALGIKDRQARDYHTYYKMIVQCPLLLEYTAQALTRYAKVVLKMLKAEGLLSPEMSLIDDSAAPVQGQVMKMEEPKYPVTSLPSPVPTVRTNLGQDPQRRSVHGLSVQQSSQSLSESYACMLHAWV